MNLGENICITYHKELISLICNKLNIWGTKIQKPNRKNSMNQTLDKKDITSALIQVEKYSNSDLVKGKLKQHWI